MQMIEGLDKYNQCTLLCTGKQNKATRRTRRGSMLEIRCVSIVSHISSCIYIPPLYDNVYACLDIHKPFVNLEDDKL